MHVSPQRDRGSYQVVQLDGVNTLIDTRDDLHCDSRGVDMVRIEAVTQPRHSCCDFVELHALLASIWSAMVSIVTLQGRRCTTLRGTIDQYVPRLKTNIVN